MPALPCLSAQQTMCTDRVQDRSLFPCDHQAPWMFLGRRLIVLGRAACPNPASPASFVTKIRRIDDSWRWRWRFPQTPGWNIALASRLLDLDCLWSWYIHLHIDRSVLQKGVMCTVAHAKNWTLREFGLLQVLGLTCWGWTDSLPPCQSLISALWVEWLCPCL